MRTGTEDVLPVVWPQGIITLPEHFEALNRDFRYQLTVIGTFAQAIIAKEVENNRFTIVTGGPGESRFPTSQWNAAG